MKQGDGNERVKVHHTDCVRKPKKKQKTNKTVAPASLNPELESPRGRREALAVTQGSMVPNI